MRTHYMVKSIFGPTLQGEGTFAGTCVKFLRFAGCNRWTGLEKHRASSFCKFCDTDFRGGTKMTADEIVTALDKIDGPKRVVLTGGEPTMQITEDLLKKLFQAGYGLHMETNGSNAIGNLHYYFRCITMSPKQSRAETKLESCHDLKLLFPLNDPDVNIAAFESFPALYKYLQPVMDDEYEKNLALTINQIYKKPNWKLSLQTHKIVGVQ